MREIARAHTYFCMQIRRILRFLSNLNFFRKPWSHSLQLTCAGGILKNVNNLKLRREKARIFQKWSPWKYSPRCTRWWWWHLAVEKQGCCCSSSSARSHIWEEWQANCFTNRAARKWIPDSTTAPSTWHYVQKSPEHGEINRWFISIFLRTI